MKTRIAWRGLIGYLLVLLGTLFGLVFARWPINGVTLGSILLIGIGGFLVGTVVTR